MARIDSRAIIVDAGPLIHLDELGSLDLLGDFQPLLTPGIVWDETRKHRPKLQTEQVPGLEVVSEDFVPSPRLAVFADTFSTCSGRTVCAGPCRTKLPDVLD